MRQLMLCDFVLLLPIYIYIYLYKYTLYYCSGTSHSSWENELLGRALPSASIPSSFKILLVFHSWTHSVCFQKFIWGTFQAKQRKNQSPLKGSLKGKLMGHSSEAIQPSTAQITDLSFYSRTPSIICHHAPLRRIMTFGFNEGKIFGFKQSGVIFVHDVVEGISRKQTL